MKAAIKTTVICAMFTMAGCADKAAEQQQMARAAAINKNVQYTMAYREAKRELENADPRCFPLYEAGLQCSKPGSLIHWTLAMSFLSGRLSNASIKQIAENTIQERAQQLLASGYGTKMPDYAAHAKMYGEIYLRSKEREKDNSKADAAADKLKADAERINNEGQ